MDEKLSGGGGGVRDDSQRLLIRLAFQRADHFCASSSTAIKTPGYCISAEPCWVKEKWT